jgi:hypothetical protein
MAFLFWLMVFNAASLASFIFSLASLALLIPSYSTASRSARSSSSNE